MPARSDVSQTAAAAAAAHPVSCGAGTALSQPCATRWCSCCCSRCIACNMRCDSREQDVHQSRAVHPASAGQGRPGRPAAMLAPRRRGRCDCKLPTPIGSDGCLQAAEGLLAAGICRAAHGGAACCGMGRGAWHGPAHCSASPIPQGLQQRESAMGLDADVSLRPLSLRPGAGVNPFAGFAKGAGAGLKNKASASMRPALIA